MMRLDFESTMRWREKRNVWSRPDGPCFSPPAYEVAPVDEGPAKAFVLQHHYAGSWPSPRLRYGLYRGEDLVGVAVLSVPSNNLTLKNPFPGLTPMWESIELGRFVLLDDVPYNGESWFLARCFELARKEGIRGVVSFSDPVARTNADGTLVFPGHLGKIYQASNAIFAGRGTARSLDLLPDGTVFNERAAQKIRKQEEGNGGAEARLMAYGAPPRQAGEDEKVYLRRALAAIGARKLRHPGNLRYLFLIGSSREKRAIEIGITRGPYPKSLETA